MDTDGISRTFQIGNHESTQCPGDHVDASTEQHYLNQTAGAAYGQMTQLLKATESRATSAIGHLLTKGALLARAVHQRGQSKPSGTSEVRKTTGAMI